MAITYLASRIVGNHADQKPGTDFPPAPPLYRMFEELDTGDWYCYLGGVAATGWFKLGNGGAIITGISGPYEQGLVPAPASGIVWPPPQPLIDTSTKNLPFQVSVSTTEFPPGYFNGQRLFEADTHTYYRWSGAQWVPSGAASQAVGSSDEKSGSLFIGNGGSTVYTIAHGLGVTPNLVLITPASAAAIGQNATAANQGYVVTANATNITVTYQVATTGGAGSVQFYWYARP